MEERSGENQQHRQEGGEMKETNIIKKKQCVKCRHYAPLRGQERGSCGAFIAVPFWMMVENTVNATDGTDCNLYMDIPNGVDEHANNSDQRKTKEKSGS